MNFETGSVVAKRGILSLLFWMVFLPFSLMAQTNPQGFYLDSWLPKSIEIKDYENVNQTVQPSTATVTIDAGAILSKVSRYVYGHNAAGWGGKLEQNAQLVNDIMNLAPQVIRWPGGNMSNDYFWNATGLAICPKDLPPTFAFTDLLYGANKSGWTMSLDSYYDLLAKTNSTGIITVNYAYARYSTSSDPVAVAARYAADWVRYDNGRTKFWEIGNENYGKWETGYTIDQKLNKDGQPATINGDLYGKHCKVFIEEMRKAAREVGNDIKIGVVAMDSYVSYDVIQRDWNAGMMKQVANEADFMIVHSYYTPYNENSTVPTVLNSAFNTKNLKTYVTDGLKTNVNHAPLPLALTEWNIFAVLGGQAVSYINGMHATLVLGELIKNEFGQGSRWDFMNGWDDGNSHGLFADGEPGIARYTPRAPFFYMYYFQKFFGDKLVQSTVTGSTDVISYASKFSSGQSGIVLVNKGASEQVVSLKINNFKVGGRYYYYLLTGGTDNGDFSRKVYVNGISSINNGGGPSNYDVIKPFSSSLTGDIKLTMPKLSTIFMVVESDLNLQKQTITFPSISSKSVGDPDFSVVATASTGLTVQFASSNSNVATIFNGKVHIIGAGTCNIIAYQDGNDLTLPATQVTQQLTVIKGNQQINFSVLPPKSTGDSDFPTGATASSGLSCTYSSSNPAVAAIVNGLIQIKGAGSAFITAKQGGNVNYNAAADVSKEIIVAVGTGVSSLSVEDDFELFPNPATDFVRTRLNAKKSMITIFNARGAIVYVNSTFGSEMTIPASVFVGKGVYFVRINSKTKKLLII